VAASAPEWAAVKKDLIAVIADDKMPGGIGEKGPTLVRSQVAVSWIKHESSHPSLSTPRFVSPGTPAARMTA